MRDDLMVQQQVENVWQHMVGVICLNQTGRKQVKAVLPEFFSKWPTHKALLHATKNEIEEIKWLQERYISCLECNTKLSRKKIQKMLSKQVDVYISADEAVEYGIVDKII